MMKLSKYAIAAAAALSITACNGDDRMVQFEDCLTIIQPKPDDGMATQEVWGWDVEKCPWLKPSCPTCELGMTGGEETMGSGGSDSHESGTETGGATMGTDSQGTESDTDDTSDSHGSQGTDSSSDDDTGSGSSMGTDSDSTGTHGSDSDSDSSTGGSDSMGSTTSDSGTDTGSTSDDDSTSSDSTDSTDTGTGTETCDYPPPPACETRKCFPHRGQWCYWHQGTGLKWLICLKR